MKEIIQLIQIKKYRKFFLWGASISLLTAAAAIYELHSTYILEVERAKIQSDNLSQVLEEQMFAIITRFDLTLSETVRTIEHQTGRRELDLIKFRKTLEARQKDIPEAQTFFIVDKNGYDVLRKKEGKKIYFGDREYFQAQKNLTDQRLFISKPIVGRLSGTPSVAFSRKFLNSDGTFGGVVAITIPLSYFRGIYSHIDVGREGSISLGSNENIIYARYPWNDNIIGAAIANHDVTNALFSGTTKVKHLDRKSAVDGTVRYGSTRRVGESKFFVYVGISKNEILAAWKKRCILYFCGFVFFWIGGAIHLVRFLQSQQELEERRKVSVQSAKLASLGEMASGIAHEINNPLAVIHSRTLHLRRQIDRGQYDPEAFKDSLTKINQTVDRIAKIIRGLKSFSRNAEGDPLVSTPLKSIVDNTLELCNEKFRHHRVILKVDPIPDITVDCRESQLVQVLLNLLNNAYDAVEDKKEQWVHISFNMVKRNHISIMVTDSGNGISEEVAQNIMNPFFTTKEVGKGTGLGLSISKGIVEGHKGDFYLDRKSINTRFVISLPIVQLNFETVKRAG